MIKNIKKIIKLGDKKKRFAVLLNKTINILIAKNKNISLDGNGERVDIFYNGYVGFDKLDMYQKSHLRRYEFASNFISSGGICGDFACGTGYGSVMLAEKSRKVIGADINSKVIEKIKQRYPNVSNLEFVNSNLLDLNYVSLFDSIVSFETMEHFTENKIVKLLGIFNRALRTKGKLILSVPFRQEQSYAAMKLGFHQAFNINEEKLEKWLNNTNFRVLFHKYQNYDTHIIMDCLLKKDFIICISEKL